MEALNQGLPDSTLLGGLAFSVSQLPSAAAATTTVARSPRGCTLILSSHMDMLAHACKTPCLHAQALPAPHPPVYPF